MKHYTEQLVALRSVSPGTGEVRVAEEILCLLYADGLEESYTESGLDPVVGDPYERQNVYAFLRGSSASTVILLGHFDTVDTQDYGKLESWSLDPDILAGKLDELLPASEHSADLSDWMFGRGVADMKSGIAVNIALLRHFAIEARDTPLPLSILLVATPDEENESAGVLQAVHFLLRLRERYHLDYLGALNTDYVTALYPGDTHRYIYAGSIGKLLPSFLCIGHEGHAGLPFNGLDANLLAAELIRDLSMNDDLCDVVPGQMAAPPVTLRLTDLKAHYDVQLPLAAYFYVNMLTLTTRPAELLERLCKRAETVMAQLLHRVDATEQRWRQARGEQGWQERFRSRSGSILTYEELYAETAQLIGQERVDDELMQEAGNWSPTLDSRERCLCIAQHLWKLRGRQGPAVIIFYAPPYYPAVAPAAGPLQAAVDAVVSAHSEVDLEQQPYFPYLSDMSYLRLDAGVDLAALKANMPIWRRNGSGRLSGDYSLPLAEMQSLGIPVINWGPFGRGAHQRDEAVLMSYTFGVLPQMLYETIITLSASLMA
ncbi:MAG TPA: M20/M25/M40 family metallo-hydrolase [Ktedonobacteraceae bacterium]